jgi:hypothetical protein
MVRIIYPSMIIASMLCHGCASDAPVSEVVASDAPQRVKQLQPRQPQERLAIAEVATPVSQRTVPTDQELEKAFERRSQALIEQADLAQDQIAAFERSHLLRDPKRPWIGKFSNVAGPIITISPSGLVTLTDSSCFGTYGEWGRIQESTPTTIRVALEAADPVLVDRVARNPSPELHFFRWRGYDFVATSEMLDKYVEDCNDGKDPERRFDAFPIRTPVNHFGPLEVPRGPEGRPPVPAKYLARLLHHPLTMRVVKAVAVPRDSEPGHNPAIFDVVLDKGSDDGVFQGMEFSEDAAGRTQRISVYEVMTRRSIARVVVSRFRTTDNPPIKEGTTFYLPGMKASER